MKHNLKWNNNKLSCRNDAAGRYCTFCFAVMSNVTFFGKTYTNDNPLFVKNQKDS